MSTSYYIRKLTAQRLKHCYDIAPPRVQQYLKAEVDFVLDRIRPGDIILDMGCGYGRIMPPLAKKAGMVIGIDISLSSLRFGKPSLQTLSNCLLLGMDAGRMAFLDEAFDAALCIQNGISAFGMNPLLLILEGLRVIKENGHFFVSSYSEKFWEHRLEWFQMQAAEGLVGEIDWAKTGDGIIVCQDGFRATTFTARQFLAVTSELGVGVDLIETDESSLFCVIKKREKNIPRKGQDRPPR